jgi:hypothetical protein
MSKSHKCTFEAPEISSWTLNVTHDEQSGIYWEDALFTPVVSPPFGKFIIGSTYLTAPAVKRSPWVKNRANFIEPKALCKLKPKQLRKGETRPKGSDFCEGIVLFLVWTLRVNWICRLLVVIQRNERAVSRIQHNYSRLFCPTVELGANFILIGPAMSSKNGNSAQVCRLFSYAGSRFTILGGSRVVWALRRCKHHLYLLFCSAPGLTPTPPVALIIFELKNIFRIWFSRSRRSWFSGSAQLIIAACSAGESDIVLQQLKFVLSIRAIWIGTSRN